VLLLFQEYNIILYLYNPCKQYLYDLKKGFIGVGVYMLLSSMSSSMVSSSAATSAMSMFITPGLPQYGALIVVGLIALLSLKEVLSASEKWNKYLNTSFNQAILPLLLVFASIVYYKVTSVL
jgi:hypothetical protein